MSIKELFFHQINLKDSFFDSLRADYQGFDKWFFSKREQKAFVSCNEHNIIDGFLYLKIENEKLDDITPSFVSKKRIKLGTFKIDAHGTKLGERFIRIVNNYAIKNNIKEIYVTIFDKHTGLIKLLCKYGFELKAKKNQITHNGQEGVYFKTLEWKD